MVTIAIERGFQKAIKEPLSRRTERVLAENVKMCKIEEKATRYMAGHLAGIHNNRCS